MRGKNTYKKEETKEKGKPSPQKRPQKENPLKSLLDGSILTKKIIVNSIPLFILLFFLGITFITNRYMIEKTSLEINDIKKQLDVLQMRHTQINGEYMRIQRITEISKRLDTLGIREATSQPKKIVIKTDK